jgi:hypothetical protein
MVYRGTNLANQGDRDQTIWDQGERPFIQKNVAAFVLYPNLRPDAQENKFFKSISKVGIGGLPFLPEQTGLVNGVLAQLLTRTSDTEEDLAVELGSEDERQRIKQSLEYGLMGIIASPEQLQYIKRHRIYHTPETGPGKINRQKSPARGNVPKGGSHPSPAGTKENALALLRCLSPQGVLFVLYPNPTVETAGDCVSSLAGLEWLYEPTRQTERADGRSRVRVRGTAQLF